MYARNPPPAPSSSTADTASGTTDAPVWARATGAVEGVVDAGVELPGPEGAGAVAVTDCDVVGVLEADVDGSEDALLDDEADDEGDVVGHGLGVFSTASCSLVGHGHGSTFTSGPSEPHGGGHGCVPIVSAFLPTGHGQCGTVGSASGACLPPTCGHGSGLHVGSAAGASARMMTVGHGGFGGHDGRTPRSLPGGAVHDGAGAGVADAVPAPSMAASPRIAAITPRTAAARSLVMDGLSDEIWRRDGRLVVRRWHDSDGDVAGWLDLYLALRSGLDATVRVRECRVRRIRPRNEPCEDGAHE